MKIKYLIAAILMLMTAGTQAQTQSGRETIVDFETTMGPIKIKLYDDTPRHRDNFVKLVKEGKYDGVLFHRVIKDFMVQTGDPNSKDAKAGDRLGDGDLGYTQEAEIIYPKHYHKYGAVAAARTGDQVNPERRSSASQFYIVTGNKYSSGQMDRLAEQSVVQERQAMFRKLVRENQLAIQGAQESDDPNELENLKKKLIEQVETAIPARPLPADIVKDYTTIGGTPHLDGQYTVFGEVVEGMDTVEKIQQAATDRNDRPVEDIRVIKARVE